MNQIPLRLRKVISYNPDSFYWHTGLSQIKIFVEDHLLEPGFSSAFLHGSKRCGKTHLAIVINRIFSERGYYPSFIEDSELSEINAANISSNSLFIIDDFQNFNVSSSAFIDFYENLRCHAGKLIILADCHYLELSLDQHFKSRLATMPVFQLEAFSEDDFLEVLFQIARQRGLKFNEHTLEYLSKRLPRTVEGIEEYLDRLEYFVGETGQQINRNTLSLAL